MAEQYAYDLKRVGKYNTIVAAGGEQALDILARDPVDCLVLDLEMPGTDGFEVLRRLARKTLVLEFVALDDEKIRDDPGFFPNLGKFDSANYNLESAVQAGRRHFPAVEVRASHPSTRTILVFDK